MVATNGEVGRTLIVVGERDAAGMGDVDVAQELIVETRLFPAQQNWRLDRRRLCCLG